MTDLLGVVRQQAEHAPSWPNGWVRWSLSESNPLHARQIKHILSAVSAGYLTLGTDDGVLDVHITQEGKDLLANNPKENSQ